MYISKKYLILSIIINILNITSKVYSIKSNLGEEIDKNNQHHDQNRYNSPVSSAAAAGAVASSYPSAAAMNYYNSYYPSPSSPYRYNGIGSAEPYERTAREYSSQSNTNSMGAGGGYIDLLPAATDSGGHGGQSQQSHGHGWGWGGYGGGGGHGQYTKVSNTGFGLLGLLGLLSLLQQVLNAMTTTTAAPPGRRKKRTIGTQPVEQLNRVSQLVLPNLNIIAHASSGGLPLECTHRETCIVNGIFLKELGPQGYLIGHQMSGAIQNLLKKIDKTGLINKHIDIAGQNGRKGLNCHEIYPICPELYKNGTIVYPPSLLLIE